MIEKVKLNSVCEIRNGFAFKSEEFQDSGVPLIRISNFDNGAVSIDNNAIYVDEKYLQTKKDFVVEKGDVLIALSGATTGKYGIYNQDFPSLLNQRIGLVKSGKSKNLSDKYFYYCLGVLKDEILRNAGGAAQPNISTKTIGELEIPLPPLTEQKKIAALLDAADSLRQKDKALVAKYDELTQSLFLEMFGDPVRNEKGWEKIRFDELVSKDCPLTYGIVQPGEEFENGVFCVRPVDLIEQYITSQNLKRIDPLISKKFNRTILSGGELLLSVRGSVGVISIADLSLKGCNVTRGIVPIWFDHNISNKLFFYYLYRSVEIQREVGNLARGATLIQINLKDLRELKIIKPPIKLQNQFAERVQAIEKQKSLAQVGLKKSEELFEGLLGRVFK